MVLLRTAGIPVIWLSGRHSDATELRARELKVEEVLQVPGPAKLETLGPVLQRRGLPGRRSPTSATIWPTSRCSAASGCPSRSPMPWPRCGPWPTRRTRALGGHGAVREVIEALLKARGVWPEMLERYFTEPAIRGA